MIIENNIGCAFSNVNIALCMFLILMVTNCSAECLFSRLKMIKNPIKTSMQQGRLHALSVLCLEVDVLCKLDHKDLIKDFARKKVGENYLTKIY